MTFASNIQYAFKSAAGPRTSNEDRILCWKVTEEIVAAAVADGVGGHSGGAIAAEIAISYLQEQINLETIYNLQALASKLNSKIVRQQELDPLTRRMATTLSMGIFIDGQFRGMHCGDSRVIMSRGDRIRKLTQEHNEAARLLREGILTAEQARLYPRKNILENALGARKHVVVDEIDCDYQPGDRFFFMTDGVSEKILTQEILHISASYASAEDVVSAVMAEVERRGPTDNYSFGCAIIK